MLIVCLVGLAVCITVASPRLRGLLANTAWLTGGALLVSLPVGIVLAVGVVKTSLPGRRLLELLLVALLLVPLVVQAAAWQATAGQGGWLFSSRQGPVLEGWAGAIWVHGVAAVAWVVLFVGAALRMVPRELEEEALQDTVAGRVLLKVSLPRAASAIFAAALWIAVACSSQIAVTDLFQIRTFAEEIYTVASLGGLIETPPVPGSLAADTATTAEMTTADLWCGTVALGLLVASALFSVWGWTAWRDFLSLSYGWTWQLQRGKWPIGLAIWLLATILVVIPLVSLLGKVGAEIERHDGQLVHSWSAAKATKLVLASPIEHRREWGASLVIGGIAAAAATLTGLLLAWAMRTGALPTLPVALILAFVFALPGPLLGIWLIEWFSRPEESPLSFLSWCYDNTLLAPVLVQFLRGLPLATLILGTQLASVPQDGIDSARSEGAGWWQQLHSVVVPQRWPAVVAAFGMSLIVCLGELSGTLLVTPPGVSTLSVRIFGLLHYGAEDRAAALSLTLALLLGLLAVIAWQLPRWLRVSR